MRKPTPSLSASILAGNILFPNNPILAAEYAVWHFGETAHSDDLTQELVEAERLYLEGGAEKHLATLIGRELAADPADADVIGFMTDADFDGLGFSEVMFDPETGREIGVDDQMAILEGF